jgi:hypothetical protein
VPWWSRIYHQSGPDSHEGGRVVNGEPMIEFEDDLRFVYAFGCAARKSFPKELVL